MFGPVLQRRKQHMKQHRDTKSSIQTASIDRFKDNLMSDGKMLKTVNLEFTKSCLISKTQEC